MDIDLKPGKYIVAVSGGVDSMVLLHVLMQKQKNEGRMKNEGAKNPSFLIPPSSFQFIVAHYDHGIRLDSAEDRRLVQAVAEQHNLPFVYEEGHLGSEASEDKARQARYNFLRRVRNASKADAIITAHHQDDVLETAILNMLRGTSRHGLIALRSRDDLLRPLLSFSKRDLQTYAHELRLLWREDSTNQDMRYRRNMVRTWLLTRFSEADRTQLLGYINQVQQIHDEVEQLVASYLQRQPTGSQLYRTEFIGLPHIVAREIMVAWLRHHKVQDISRRRLEQLVIACKTLKSGKLIDVDKHWQLEVTTKTLALKLPDR